MFRWLTQRRRRNLLAQPFPASWLKILPANCVHYAELSLPEQQKLRDDLYQQLVTDCEEGRKTLLNGYGATNIGEFFAVSTECFFELPRQMEQRHPVYYALMRDYFRQDPAARVKHG